MNRQYFQIGGLTISLESSIEFEKTHFKSALIPFIVDFPGPDLLTIQRFFRIPNLIKQDLGLEIIHDLPWTIFENKKSNHYYYLGKNNSGKLNIFADFSDDYSIGKIYSHRQMKNFITNNGWQNLTGFASDNLWLANPLTDYSALLLHSAAVGFEGNGFLFLGRSEAGKTTTIKLFQKAREVSGSSIVIFCDETNIVRRWEDGWRVHGTWGHGEEKEVSPTSAPLRGVFVLTKDRRNYIEKISNKQLILQILLSVIFRPLMTESWWEKVLNIIDLLIHETPFYEMHFDKTGRIIPILHELTY